MTQKAKSIFWSTLLLAIAAPFVISQSVAAYVASEYRTDADLAVGSLVALDVDGSLVSASSEVSDYIGVVAAKSGGSLEVATSGTVSMLVSDIDGDIEVDSQLSLSSIAGVATKSTGTGSPIGIVVASPSGWSSHSAEGDVDTTVNVGTAAVKLVHRPSAISANSDSQPNLLQRIASSVAGREVDTWRAIVAATIGLSGIALAFVLLISSSRSSFMSLGRNPMAGGAIMGGLWKVAAVAVGIMLVSLTAAYLIVRLA